MKGLAERLTGCDIGPVANRNAERRLRDARSLREYFFFLVNLSREWKLSAQSFHAHVHLAYSLLHGRLI